MSFDKIIDDTSYKPLYSLPNFSDLNDVQSIIQFILKLETNANNSTYNFQYVALTSIILGYIESRPKKNKVIFPIKRKSITKLWNLFTSFSEKIKQKFTIFPVKATKENILIIKNEIMKINFTKIINRKDNSHSIYCFLKNKELDIFGLCIMTLCVCHHLGMGSSVYLALTESHSWLCINDPNSEKSSDNILNIELSTDFNNNDIPKELVHSWKYFRASPIIVNNFFMIITVLTMFINPEVNNSVSNVLLTTKQQILSILYELGYLNNFPNGLVTLAKLEEKNSLTTITKDIKMMRSKAMNIYKIAITSSVSLGNLFVQPQIYLGDLLLNEPSHIHHAINCYAASAEVLSEYSFTNADDKIYSIIKMLPLKIKEIILNHKADLINYAVFGHILRFLDGLLKWEENGKRSLVTDEFCTDFWEIYQMFPLSITNNIDNLTKPLLISSNKMRLLIPLIKKITDKDVKEKFFKILKCEIFSHINDKEEHDINKDKNLNMENMKSDEKDNSLNNEDHNELVKKFITKENRDRYNAIRQKIAKETQIFFENSKKIQMNYDRERSSLWLKHYQQIFPQEIILQREEFTFLEVFKEVIRIHELQISILEGILSALNKETKNSHDSFDKEWAELKINITPIKQSRINTYIEQMRIEILHRKCLDKLCNSVNAKIDLIEKEKNQTNCRNELQKYIKGRTALLNKLQSWVIYEQRELQSLVSKKNSIKTNSTPKLNKEKEDKLLQTTMINSTTSITTLQKDQGIPPPPRSSSNKTATDVNINKDIETLKHISLEDQQKILNSSYTSIIHYQKKKKDLLNSLRSRFKVIDTQARMNMQQLKEAYSNRTTKASQIYNNTISVLKSSIKNIQENDSLQNDNVISSKENKGESAENLDWTAEKNTEIKNSKEEKSKLKEEQISHLSKLNMLSVNQLRFYTPEQRRVIQTQLQDYRPQIVKAQINERNNRIKKMKVIKNKDSKLKSKRKRAQENNYVEECYKVSNVKLYCLCKQPYRVNEFMVGCDKCDDWFHPSCIGTTAENVQKLDKFYCPRCIKIENRDDKNVGGYNEGHEENIKV